VELPLFTRNSGIFSFRVHHKISHRLQYFALILFSLPLRWLPRRARSAGGAFLGQLIYLIGIRRKVTEQNLRAAFPSMPTGAVRQVCARVYRHFGRVAVSFVALPRISTKDLGKWIYFDGLDVLQQILHEGKGGIFYSGHIGNWEVMGAIAAQLGLPVTFVVARQSNRDVEELIDHYRESAGIEVVKRADAVRGILQALRRNRLVAIMIDQDAHEDGAFVPFFGRLASAPRGPAVFHIRSGAPLVFALSRRLPGEKYYIRFTRMDTEGETNPDVLTARMTAVLEAAIRETPEQWFWMHRRWKTRPPAS